MGFDESELSMRPLRACVFFRQFSSAPSFSSDQELVEILFVINSPTFPPRFFPILLPPVTFGKVRQLSLFRLASFPPSWSYQRRTILALSERISRSDV